MMRSSFTHDLNKLNIDLINMGGMVEQAIAKSVKALENRDPQLAKEVVEGDRDIDEMEKKIEAQCLKLLLRQQPVAGDLRSISTALKMITDMERIGDQAADIADISIHLCEYEDFQIISHIPKMARTTVEMVRDSLDCFVQNDLKLAQNVIARDDEVDAMFDSVKSDLIEILKNDPDKSDLAIDFMMIAKYLERIGDHAVNICEWEQFQSTGEHKNFKII